MTTVVRIDPAESAVFSEFYDAYRRSFNREFDQPYTAVELAIDMVPDDYNSTVAVLARDSEGVVVGGAWAELPLKDNLTFAYGEVFVVPEQRRHGHGSVLVEALADACAGAGRSTLLCEGAWGVDDQEAPAKQFAEQAGFTLEIMDAHRELLLPAKLPALVIDSAYEIRSWRGACPDELIDGYADVRRLMVQEAPSGDAGLENEHWDAARVRSEEAKWEKSGRVPQVSVAIAGDGSVVGHTQLIFPRDSVEVYQWDTLVLSSHRGHGLGLALKVFTMHEAADLLDGRRRIHTYNAASNQHMIAVNETMGFRQVAWLAEYIRTI
ncbi:GNAT superfamily N-acetyltransferase [Aeromicrobium panaciterrae]|uniref:GNAT superfamily N-acetyltransferase n=1 Tax=Aeromicrobium panaciterrae TaxID=363861 RepID=A0ABU1URE9_9ACTN|nr:GNAT family N-acetyltransferase [Aeromicrobium panaciterrae]MDR7087737.1 GNAT superfamily N-acetyltransferase [Aeromicrobium panaciterrae]